VEKNRIANRRSPITPQVGRAVSKRTRFSRWKRLPGTLFRTGDHARSSTGDEERRLTLYIPWRLLDQAELLAKESAAASIQQYCETLLAQAIESELAARRLLETEGGRGPLEGLAAIAADPEYLAEWSNNPRHVPHVNLELHRESDELPLPEIQILSVHHEPANTEPTTSVDHPAEESAVLHREQTSEHASKVEASTAVAEESPCDVVIRHAALGVESDPLGFLPCLRRAEAPDARAISELLTALVELERDHAGDAVIDRSLAYALHRLAFESQVLVMDAWQGAPIDRTTRDALHAIQECVDRVLSGQDIRYDATEPPATFG
jgi:hypothetical protein